MSTFYQRGIHKAALRKSMQSKELKRLLDIVRLDKNFVVFLRDDYFNVYYRGGNVAKVESAKSVQFDKEYFREHKNKEEEDYSFINKRIEEATALFKAGRYQEYLNMIIAAMEHYFELGLKNGEEKESQHQLCVNNTFESASEYILLDVEYMVSIKSKFAYCGKRRCGKDFDSIPRPRFDIIAIRKADGKICIMELKKGTKALTKKSGIGEHAESFENTVGYSKEREKFFVDEMRSVLSQMKDLNLIDNRIEILSDEVEYMFVFQENSKELNTANQVQVFRDTMKKELQREGLTKEYPVIELRDKEYSLRNNRL